jgi:hypothetical protein
MTAPMDANDQTSDESSGADPPVAPVVVFELTTRQRRRTRWGLIGLAAMAWSAGAVRFALDDRLSSASGWLSLLALAALLVLAVAALGGIQPLVVLTDDTIVIRRGPRHAQVPWSEVTGVEIRERGTARRAVLHHGDGHLVLPVPLTGGSLVGPGPDPGLDHKVELIEEAWQRHGRNAHRCP